MESCPAPPRHPENELHDSMLFVSSLCWWHHQAILVDNTGIRNVDDLVPTSMTSWQSILIGEPVFPLCRLLHRTFSESIVGNARLNKDFQHQKGSSEAAGNQEPKTPSAPRWRQVGVLPLAAHHRVLRHGFSV